MYSVEDGERGGDMPRLYSFTIGRRNRDAAVQSVRVAATRQPQTALEQSEKAYLYSLVVSSAGYREGQPPTATLVTTCFLCGTLSASSLSPGWCWPIATQVIPTGRVAYTPSAYIYIYKYITMPVFCWRGRAAQVLAPNRRAPLVTFFFPSSSSCVSADVVVMGTREKPIDVWGKKEEDGGGGRSGKNGARLL